MIYNALTIDVEDYYMVSAFADVIKFEDWNIFESRVERNTYKILQLLDQRHVKATFFILGWVAEHHPQLVRDIKSGDHEIACHGYNHRLVYDMSPEAFRKDIRVAKDRLEDVTGVQVIGYRAPSYSIVKNTLWALDVLIEEGFLYDSSIFPIRHDRYGFPEAERFPHFIRRTNGDIMEFPPSTYRILKQNIPIAGGGYLRLFPLNVTRQAIRYINSKDNKPAIIYIHPWEIDENQPKINGKWQSRLRHYVNMRSTMPKLEIFLNEFRFQPLAEFLQ
jgi:polysaccharide deacetylase family protein (PEP-CTERM system associated)